MRSLSPVAQLAPASDVKAVVEDDLPVFTPIPRMPPGSNEPVAKCGECGMLLCQVMGYVCPRSNCPVQPVTR